MLTVSITTFTTTGPGNGPRNRKSSSLPWRYHSFQNCLVSSLCLSRPYQHKGSTSFLLAVPSGLPTILVASSLGLLIHSFSFFPFSFFTELSLSYPNLQRKNIPFSVISVTSLLHAFSGRLSTPSAWRHFNHEAPYLKRIFSSESICDSVL